MDRIRLIDLGKIGYRAAWALQQETFEGRREGEIGDTLIVARHLPTLTLGKSSRREDIYLPADRLCKEDIELVEVERGGGVTYHGPGQLVLYPIFDLRNFDKDLREFVSSLERTMEETANLYGVPSETRPGYPGLWVPNKDDKLGSIGLYLKQWVSMHGLSLNVSLTKATSELLCPCGLDEVQLVSLADYAEVELQEVKNDLLNVFQDVFEVEVEREGSLA